MSTSTPRRAIDPQVLKRLARAIVLGAHDNAQSPLKPPRWPLFAFRGGRKGDTMTDFYKLLRSIERIARVQRLLGFKPNKI